MRSDAKLNLGCGPLLVRGEVGMDRYKTAAVNVQGDVEHLPFRDGCAKFVRLDHVLEHLPYRKAVPALLEAYRVLRSGGKIRVGLPDLKACCEAFLSAADLWEKGALIRQLYGSQAHEGEFHKSGWDQEMAADLVRSVGFKEVEVVCDEDKDYWKASMVVWGVRP